MKSLTLLTLVFVFLMGTGSLPSFSLTDVEAPKITFGKLVSQNCPEKLEDADAEVVFLELIAVEHPLGKNSCGDWHSIEGIDLHGKSSPDLGIRQVNK